MTHPRTFQLHRDQDPTGISGTGVVAEGCEFSDGKTVLRWLGEHPSVNTFDTLGAAEAEAVHGHGSMTRLVYTDDDPADRLLADSEAQGQAERDRQAGRAWEVLVTVMGPTPADAERWAGGVADMVIAEFQDTMRLTVTVRPVPRELDRAEIERLIAASSLGTPGVQAVVKMGRGEALTDEERRAAADELTRLDEELGCVDWPAKSHACFGGRCGDCPGCFECPCHGVEAAS